MTTQTPIPQESHDEAVARLRARLGADRPVERQLSVPNFLKIRRAVASTLKAANPRSTMNFELAAEKLMERGWIDTDAVLASFREEPMPVETDDEEGNNA